MSIPLRNEEEIVKLREACRLAQDVLVMIEPYVKAGVSTGELDRICHDYMVNVQGTIPAPLNYHGFPKATCISINEVVCHGIPSDDRILKDGDILNIDVTVIKDGYYGDNSKMYIVGEPPIRSKKLVEAAQEALYVGLRAVKPGVRLNEIGKAVQKYTESQGFSVVREYCGHGIGTEFHCEPQVLHYYADDGGVILQKGMVFTIEPMINAGKKETRLMGDGWTVKTKDRSHSAQYEHQIVVTDNGCEVMTIREEEEKAGRISRVMVNV
ncbi:type I methionyl aminopeptidase [Actinobacillus porcinus]|uniref:Methionine aminopeptidase n=1 Tax=Actinobacillus porcinus TaxID=51048 RepID=A0ABY6TKI7_9PAST|nr:type I methionyl aminopeptidase [Actinobacillus porcinus]MDD7545300.1 type I methionyl aminopeptidase [Actinobacillus porcinus]MDY5848178.1 type I methionyl aminopeptidase [Actinobacillus porcinus]VFY92940.1 methionine aminopeptidase [Actinobacillus porcinus]VTU07588.1 methionine aminopeptidase [Actinobacillus porcinus]